MFRVSLSRLLVPLALFAFAPSVHAGEAPDVRLGRDLVPTFQSVRLHLDADKRNYTTAAGFSPYRPAGAYTVGRSPPRTKQDYFQAYERQGYRSH